MKFLSIFILPMLTSFLIGYTIGRRRGIREGKALGLSSGRLLIRMDSLKSGKCVICKTPIDCYKSSSMIE